jgi:hypothetical protein
MNTDDIELNKEKGRLKSYEWILVFGFFILTIGFLTFPVSLIVIPLTFSIWIAGILFRKEPGNWKTAIFAIIFVLLCILLVIGIKFLILLYRGMYLNVD